MVELFQYLWFTWLGRATQDQLKNYQFLGDGEGIHWLDIDEDLRLLRGKH